MHFLRWWHNFDGVATRLTCFSNIFRSYFRSVSATSNSHTNYTFNAKQLINNLKLKLSPRFHTDGFYNASALLALQTAVVARAILSVRPSFRHILVFYPDA